MSGAFVCAVCNAKSTVRCSRCKIARYCTREHQLADWKTHKTVCKAKTQAKKSQSMPKTGLGKVTAAEVKGGMFTTALTYENIALGSNREIKCGVILPTGFDPTQTYPVCIAISGERQQHVSRFFQAWKSERRGWVVVSPLRPNNHPLFFEDPTIIHHLAMALLQQLQVEGGKFHFVGTSNGGSTCFAFGARWPSLCHSITPVTGANLRRDDLRLLNGIPVDMFVGDQDELRFCPAMQAIYQNLLRVGHTPTPTLKILPGAGHFTIGQAVDMDAFWVLMNRRRVRVDNINDNVNG